MSDAGDDPADLPPGVERAATGELRGRNPKKMTEAELLAAGYPRHTPMDAIRAKCLQCRDNITAKILACSSVACALWPMRLGTHPWISKPKMRGEQKKAAVARLTKARAKRLTSHAAGEKNRRNRNKKEAGDDPQ